jgi:hypothetical protein
MDKTRSALVGVVACLVLLAALAGACPWSCPNGLVASKNTSYEATTNGCGPAGLLGNPPPLNVATTVILTRTPLAAVFVSEHQVGVHAVL